jgi:hypothetical protein
MRTLKAQRPTPLWLAAVTASLGLLGLSACSVLTDAKDLLGAAMRTVEEPDEKSPHALLRISTDANTWVQPGRSCYSNANPRGGVAVAASHLYIGARSLRDQRRGIIGAAPEGLASGEIRVAPGEPHVLGYSALWQKGSMQYSCRVARSFVPAEGAHYQMIAELNDQLQGCGIAVLQLSPNTELVKTTEAKACPAP